MRLKASKFFAPTVQAFRAFQGVTTRCVKDCLCVSVLHLSFLSLAGCPRVRCSVAIGSKVFVWHLLIPYMYLYTWVRSPRVCLYFWGSVDAALRVYPHMAGFWGCWSFWLHYVGFSLTSRLRDQWYDRLSICLITLRFWVHLSVGPALSRVCKCSNFCGSVFADFQWFFYSFFNSKCRYK
jgi:hypothetical protein